MQFLLTVELEGRDEPIEVSCDSRDIRKWEAEYDRSWLSSDVSVTSFAQLAWLGCRRHGLFDGGWDDFDAVCITVEQTSRPEAGNPTRKGRGGGSS